jgi:hypothetical protein
MKLERMPGRILKAIIPRGVRRRLLAHVRETSRKEREEREIQILKVPLADMHMRNCELLLNRSIMLSKLKKGGLVAEIGVDRGEFSEQIIEISRPLLLCLIDLWDSERYHAGLLETVTDKFAESIENGRVEIHRKCSTDAADDFHDDYFDWIYIDTDHSYETTKEELHKYAPKIRRDGVIAGHDYSQGNWVSSFRYGVIEAVHEFCVKDGWELIYLTLEPTENQSFAIRRIQQENTPGRK